jgi:hypothetical protein
MTVELRLQGTVTNVNGSMSMQISDHTGIKYFNDKFEPGKITIDCCIAWPTCVIIDLGNKNSDDMITTAEGIIVATKSIEIDTMYINRFPIQYELMESLFDCTHSGNDAVTHENFWGFNGQVKINFNYLSPMYYMLAIKNPFEIPRLDWLNHD